MSIANFNLKYSHFQGHHCTPTLRWRQKWFVKIIDSYRYHIWYSIKTSKEWILQFSLCWDIKNQYKGLSLKCLWIFIDLSVFILIASWFNDVTESDIVRFDQCACCTKIDLYLPHYNNHQLRPFILCVHEWFMHD